MLRHLVDLSLRLRGVVISLACVTLVWGGSSALHAKLDVFPDFAPPQVVIQTEAPGLAPEQVEQLITLPLEAALGGIIGLDSMQSESIQGLSVVTMRFQDGMDVLALRQAVTERLTTLAGVLPVGARTPTMEPLTSATMDVLKVGLIAPAMGPMDLRDLARWTLIPKLLGVPGVARVNVFGGEVRQLQIQVRPKDLLAHGLTLSAVVAAARQSTAILGAGFVDTTNQRVVLRTEGQTLTADALARVPITTLGGAPVRLGDVANVVERGAPKFGDAIIQGQPGVLLSISSQYGANTMEVTLGLERALEEFAPVFASQGVKVLPRLHRPASFIETALGNLRFSLLLGAALVVAVLVPFLGHLRTTLISVTAIPLSLLAAVLILERLGITLNTMTLGGLAIAIGEVVDDAIIDVENIVRRLRLNGQLENPRPVQEVVLEASLEVRGAVVYATFVVALVFLPLLTLSGLAGKFFAPLGLAYLLAVGASLLVALTLTPALSLVLFRRGAVGDAEPRLQTSVKRHYRALLSHLMIHPWVPVSGALLATIAAVVAIPFLGGGFLPEFREGHLVLQVSEAPGASIEEMLRVGGHISAELLALPGVATVEQQVGRAEQGEDTWGPHRSEFHVELEKGLGRGETAVVDDVRALLETYPGIQFEVLTFLGDRISETLTGETAPVVVNVFGPDLDTIDTSAAEVARVLSTVPGASEVRVKAPAGAPTMTISLRPERLAQFGILPVDALTAVRTAYQGEPVAQIHVGNRQEDVVVVLADEDRKDPDAIGALLVQGALGGAMLPLRELADVRPTSGRFSILHDGARRRQTITCVPRGRDLLSFVADAERAVRDGVTLPPGYYVEFSGTAEAQTEARRELLLEGGITGLGIVVLLWIAFQNARTLALVLTNVPFGLVGGVLAAAAAGWLGAEEGGLSMGSLVGFVTVLGITMRNSIMLVSHYRHLVHEEGAGWGIETAIRGATDRVVPILITALVTGLGILPLAIGVGTAGREIEGPMAIVILGGLASSTALNLLVLPPLAHRFGRFDDARIAG